MGRRCVPLEYFVANEAFVSDRLRAAGDSISWRRRRRCFLSCIRGGGVCLLEMSCYHSKIGMRGKTYHLCSLEHHQRTRWTSIAMQYRHTPWPHGEAPPFLPSVFSQW